MNCPHWSACGIKSGGCCAKGLYGGRPSRGICLTVCEHGPKLTPEQPKPAPAPRLPLGDYAEKAINVATLGQGKRIAKAAAKAAGKKDCGCNRRKAKLNKLGAKLAGE